MSYLLLLTKNCCCCCGPGGGANGLALRSTAFPPFTAQEAETLEQVARGTFRDTGRKCLDFFATLLSGEFQDPLVAARPTLLIKLTGLEPTGLNAANSTLCDRIPEPPLLPTATRAVPPPREIPSTPNRFIVQSRRGPQAFRSSRGFGSFATLAEAIEGMRLVIRLNPGTSARVTDTLTGIVVERINE